MQTILGDRLMRHNKNWFIWQLTTMIILFTLAACTPTTTPESVLSATPTEVPALNPVTATPEKLFAPDPDATKAPVDVDQTEGDAANSQGNSNADTYNSEVVLVYERAGGLKGIGPGIVTWTMYADGRVDSSDGRSWQVPSEDITTLADSIMAFGFAEFEESYIPKDTCCDRATHTITIYQDGKVYQVSVLDSADAPAELYQALDLIGKFLIALPT
jgi:hypothetical protein